MTGLGDGGRDLTRARQERHRLWHSKNRAAIVASGVPFADKGEALLFRERGKPKADFYPSTGRWKVGRNVYSGGAAKFLEWWKTVAA